MEKSFLNYFTSSGCVCYHYKKTLQEVGMWNNIYKKNPDIIKRKIADELILIPIGRAIGQQKKIFSLNELGDYIYELLNGINSLQEILTKVLKEFSVSREQAQADILEFVIKMREQSIISEQI